MFRIARRWLAWGRLKALVVPALVLLCVFLLYFWRLPTLTTGLSPAEDIAINASSNLQYIVDNPVNAPLRLVQLAALQLEPDNQLSARAPSVLFMISFVAMFYLLLRLWFGRLIGLLGTLILASTPWLVIISRSATPDVLLLAPLAIITLFLWLTRRTSYRNIAWLGLIVATGLSLYVPGVLWFVAAAGVYKFRDLRQIAATTNIVTRIFSILILAAILAPLVAASVKSSEIVQDLLLVPDEWQGTVGTLKSIAWSGLALVWRLPYTTDFTVGRLPLLTIVEIALAAFGSYAMWSKARRTFYGLAGIVVLSVLIAGLNSRLTLLIPAVMAVCVLAAAGLRYLYIEWNSIFPRNPLPRGFAVVLMVLVIGTHVLYGLHYALVAWPRSPATSRIYVIE
ncbi:hypothetical protein A3E49_02345 [Candidatus Saccharibacteria bacterium RIFCSPHIGHO2_12_FULL_49_19]|nr:MAG: hypothetical protein A2708_01770 [Candidatus Saccharibacteria bacterium RIFCSPHIGHO2_01_FULL_49_21]OGL37013.1 MAG: hypothetical protein A3E49_02345 [Candidatus Saccharibacteria bacterium RIFCSPHIGHO2_12_FULL_49_19]OGL38548.1 MAG: hypothetical protein A3B63_02425 [Candidatus Saccharibacteria bacterium RIFCSPLOWO2_01_FULL_49_22]